MSSEPISSRVTLWRIALRTAVAVALALLAAVSTWFYMDRVLIPYQISDARQYQRPRGNLSDLYPRWLGARALLMQGRNPYAPDVTREIQRGYYGRVLDPAQAGDPADQQGFAYPAYVIFLLVPTLNLPFAAVQQGFALVLWILTAASVLLWLRALAWRPSRATVAIFLILTLGSIPAVQGIKLQQLSLLVAALIAASAALLSSGYLILAGVFLALATIKPQLTWALAGWLMLWTAHDWRNRRKLALSFGITMVLLVGGAEWVLSGWIGQFWMAIQNYRQYTHNMSVLDWLLAPAIGSLVTVALIVLTAWLSWPSLREPAQSRRFSAGLTLVLSLTILIVPMVAPYNQVLLLPVVMMLTREGRSLWRNSRLSQLLCLITGAVVFWPWVATCALTLLSLILPPPVVQGAWKLPFLTTLTVPIFVYALLLRAFKFHMLPELESTSPR